MQTIDMTIVNEETLRHLYACEEGIEWFLEEYGDLPANEVEFMEKETPDKGYVNWLIYAFINSTYDERGNQLTRKYSDGLLIERTYDKRDNILTHKDSEGFSSERTYDKWGNMCTYKSSYGTSWVRTYDKKGRESSFKTSNGYSVVYKYDADGTQLRYRGGIKI